MTGRKTGSEDDRPSREVFDNARKGDAKALNALLKHHWILLYKLLGQKFPAVPVHIREELVQTALEQFLKGGGIEFMDSPADLKRLLFSIAVRRAIDWNRRPANNVMAQLPTDHEQLRTGLCNLSRVEDLENREKLHFVATNINNEFSQQQVKQRVFELYFLEGHSVKEIADAVGGNPKQPYRIIQEALQLAEKWAAIYDNEEGA